MAMDDNQNDDTTLAATMEQLFSNGEVAMREWYESSKEDKIKDLAQILYTTIAVDPYGYPSGAPYWDELPDIDSNHKVGNDKMRYIEAATIVYNQLMWKPKKKS